MTCPLPANTFAADADRRQVEALGLAMDNPALRYGPALNTAMQRNSGALNAMIASRCAKMQFRSNESRKRFLAVHRALAGDA